MTVKYIDRMPSMAEYAEGKRINPKMTDLINRADAIEAVRKCVVESELLADWNKAMESAQELLSALPSAELTLKTPQTYGKSITPSNAEVVEDYISRADAIGIIEDYIGKDYMTPMSRLYSVRSELSALPSAEAEFADMPDIPRYYYEKVVGNMAHEINMLKEQLESVDAKWIPCSERLPSKDGCYLVSTTGTNNDIIDIAYYTEGIWHKASRIKAWMPLPKPYKEESEVEE